MAISSDETTQPAAPNNGLLQTSLQAGERRCSSLGCAKAASRRGLCVAHYHADRRANPDRVAAEREARKRAKKKAAQARYRQKAAGKIREYLRRYHSEHRTRLREDRRLGQYGLTRETFAALLSSQAGACALCSSGVEAATCHIDHCHETGRVRGLLCASCNKGLGWYERFVRLGLEQAVMSYVRGDAAHVAQVIELAERTGGALLGKKDG